MTSRPQWASQGLSGAEVKVRGRRSPDDAEPGWDQDDSRPGEGADARKGPMQLAPQLEAWLYHPPYISLFEMEHRAWSTGNQDKSNTHSSGLDDSDSTSHSLLLCVFLNVCIPEHAACPSVRLSAVHACAHMHEQE